MAVNLVKSRNQKTNRALTAEWSTPQWLFDELDKEFHFTLDACAQPFNAKCKKFYSPKGTKLERGGSVLLPAKWRERTSAMGRES